MRRKEPRRPTLVNNGMSLLMRKHEPAGLRYRGEGETVRRRPSGREEDGDLMLEDLTEALLDRGVERGVTVWYGESGGMVGEVGGDERVAAGPVVRSEGHDGVINVKSVRSEVGVESFSLGDDSGNLLCTPVD